MCRWFTVPISHKPKSIYFQLSLFFFLQENAWTSLISILLQLVTDATLQSANFNCTWWAKLIGLVLPDLPTAVRVELGWVLSRALCTWAVILHYLKSEGARGCWEWGLFGWSQISHCNCISLPAPIIFQALFGLFWCQGDLDSKWRPTAPTGPPSQMAAPSL